MAGSSIMMIRSSFVVISPPLLMGRDCHEVSVIGALYAHFVAW
jgi:hypothetical protein